MSILKSSFLAALTASFACITPDAHALAVTLVMTSDLPDSGRAILSGDRFALTENITFVQATLADGKAPVNWAATVQLTTYSNPTHLIGLDISNIEGRHLMNPKPDGPLLSLNGRTVFPVYSTIADSFGGSLQRQVFVPHELPPVYDVMTVTLVDLNPNDPMSVTAGGAAEFRMVIDFSHGAAPVPEPSSIALLLAGGALIGLTSTRRAARRR
jgi:hypothetical protein